MVIISHKHKFIYIKTRKTASTSIQVLLEKYCGKDDVITPILEPTTKEGFQYNKRARNYKGILCILKIIKYRIKIFLLTFKFKTFLTNFRSNVFNFSLKKFNKKKIREFFGRFTSHMSARQVKLKLGNTLWNEYFKFTFERNPWDKLISWYHHRNPGLSFKEWLIKAEISLREHPINYPLYFINGKIAVNFIGKYEKLKDDLSYIFKKLKLPMENLPKEKTNYRKIKDNYKSYYDDKTKKLVYKIYQKEIKLFNYKF
ncbi:MAG: sulfotransferase family 2 domain-containing protein [Promethearchaeota archaeon]